MNPLTIQNQLRSITGPEAVDGMRLIQEKAPVGGGESADGASFGRILADSIEKVNSMQTEADAGMKRLATGESGNLHEALLSMQRAELSMRLLVEVRNKVVTAYQEISRMPV